ncbi:protein ALP1-like [Gigantopelta aegis]|uniref:protein ALP1-like n=1 Tax=Gigantopelta aegis TaxID=1735272 RepID=UPI001B88C959|nr:protein ALP1-like [Gigantopelta aegis]
MAHIPNFHRLYFAFSDILAEDDDLYQSYMMRIRSRILLLSNIPRSVPGIKGYRDVVAEMTETDFLEHFRVSRHVFEQLLDYVTPHIISNYVGGNEPLPPDQQLSIFIWYIANQESMREVSQVFGVSMSTVHGVVQKLCDVILRLRNRVSTPSFVQSKALCTLTLITKLSITLQLIRWPNEQQRQDIAQAVHGTSGFPGVIGYLGGTHIRLSAPIGGDRDYYNRKGFPSMQLQVVVDPNMTIISAYTGWPGCTHDARVLRNSPLFHKAEAGELFSPNQHIFADSAYPLRNWLITPIRNVGNLTETL